MEMGAILAMSIFGGIKNIQHGKTCDEYIEKNI